MGRAIGIDLGTTNSAAAIIEDGQPRLITYKGGARTMPSVFAIDENGNRLIGEEARAQAAQNPNQTIANAKRLIGRNFRSKKIENMKQVFTYELVEGESSEVLVKVQDQIFTLEQISAAILRRIKEAAEDVLDDEVDRAVITVPAYFNDRQRQAVRSAGKLAGLKVMRVLNEPTAAALAYGLGQTLNQRVAIYDLGGGTFDISIIDIKQKIFEVIATGGDTFLGGVDFDDRLMQHLLGRFLDDTGVDLSYDRSAITRLRDAAEAAKIQLSDVEHTRIKLEHIGDDEDGTPLDIQVDISRTELEALTEDLVERSIATCERILREAQTDRTQLDEVLLVGGQSRMPLVRRKLAEFAGKPPSNKVHPDEAVAIGASIMAHSLASQGGGTDVTLLDVLPMPIGIAKPDGSMYTLFKRHQPLPDYRSRTLTTSKDNQQSILLRVYQGDSNMVAENELLGTFVFRGIRKASKGDVKIEVTFHIDSEGILNLTARDRDTGTQVESHLKIGKEGGPRRTGKKSSSSSSKKKEKKVAPPPMPISMPTSSLAAGPTNPMDGIDPADQNNVPNDDDRVPSAPVDPASAPKDEGITNRMRKAAPVAELPQGPWARFMRWLRGLFGR